MSRVHKPSDRATLRHPDHKSCVFVVMSILDFVLTRLVEIGNAVLVRSVETFCFEISFLSTGVDDVKHRGLLLLR